MAPAPSDVFEDHKHKEMQQGFITESKTKPKTPKLISGCINKGRRCRMREVMVLHCSVLMWFFWRV